MAEAEAEGWSLVEVVVGRWAGSGPLVEVVFEFVAEL